MEKIHNTEIWLHNVFYNWISFDLNLIQEDSGA